MPGSYNLMPGRNRRHRVYPGGATRGSYKGAMAPTRDSSPVMCRSYQASSRRRKVGGDTYSSSKEKEEH
jgi:hypothetical protein